MQTLEKSVSIVDDDPAIRDALSVVLNMEGYTVNAYSSGEEFLSDAKSKVPSCVILDVHMPGRSGVDILSGLTASNFPAPVFIISGQGDIPTAVSAVKEGAFDFIEKPFDADSVLERVAEAIEVTSNNANQKRNFSDFPGAEQLTPREWDVLRQITEGASNKEAGRTLGISSRTVEVHRARIMDKLTVRNTAELVRLVLTGKIHGEDCETV